MRASRRLALGRKPPHAGGVGLLALLVTAACDASGVVVAHGTDGKESSRGARGRVAVSVADGEATLVTDRGSRLRGVTIGSDSGLDFGLESNPDAARGTIRSFFDEMALEAGINLVHVYLENQTTEHGSGLGFGDLLVEESERAGLYLLVGLGSGTLLGEFDRVRAEAFWNLYAPRYADRTHVLYELHNAPERTCDAPWAAESLALESGLFELVRSHAPETHVIAFSYLGTPTDEVLLSGVTSVAIDWTNASIGFHATDDCRPTADLATLPPVLADQPVTRLATELPQDPDAWQPATAALEARGIGWANFRFLKFSSNMADFRAQHEAANVTWCPDFGTWPMDSETCTP